MLFLACSLWIGLSFPLLSLLHFAVCMLKHQQPCSLFTLRADSEKEMQYQGCQANTKFAQMMQVTALVSGWCLLLLMARLALRFGWPTLCVPCRLRGKGCLRAAPVSTSSRRLAPNAQIFMHISTWLQKCWIACEGNFASLFLRIYILPAFV